MSAFPSLNPARQTTFVNDAGTRKIFDDLRKRVAADIARRTIKNADVVDGVSVGVALTLAHDDSERLLWLIVDKLKLALKGQRFLFIAARGPPHSKCWPVILVSSSSALLEKAITLTSAKFFGRVKNVHRGVFCWTADIDDAGAAGKDVCRLWDIARTSSCDIRSRPDDARTINELVAAAQMRLDRVSPERAYQALQCGSAIIIDIRSVNQRKIHGSIPNAVVVDRCLLEWKLDPTSDTCLYFAKSYDTYVILIDQDGLASSLAAASLQDLGLRKATDIIGGFQAWKAAGLPTTLLI